MRRPTEPFRCPGCGREFASGQGFGLHRRGQWGVDRRCATPEELQALGLRLVTMRGDPARRVWIFARHVREDAPGG